ncbi:hypothetical protein LTR04_006712 [Oleoguttula sp. CCFEE 6159]|nr:hypothetical protein LTR04_006712 [Oleoguttula sp. CCFEE 6159]
MQIPTRKRAAPGASPMVHPPPQTQTQTAQEYSMPDASGFTDDQFPDWTIQNGVNIPTAAYSEPAMYNPNSYAAAMGGLVPQINTMQPPVGAPPSSNQLVRRNTNQQMSARGGPYNNEGWVDYGTAVVQPPTTGWDDVDEDEEELEQKVAAARRDAQAKRKTIPPFVQKLSSFLDQSNNTNLIRWSDDGNSFLVLNEDEFAKTLIPDLFKHNNYASFVRQLNMYGFHKKVGLNANSMAAAEKKDKQPSEYSNRYFKRARPDLLWLVQKAKNTTSNSKRKREDDKVKQGTDSDEDVKRLSVDAGGEERKPQQGVRAGGLNQDLTTIPKSELASLHQEMQALQRQQKTIHKIITQMREQNNQLYQQATAFQTLHDRHENSINAILTFLATFYNRSLDGRHGQNLANMFGGAMPPTSQQQGSVVDVGDYTDTTSTPSNQLHRFSKRPLALLPAPASSTQYLQPGRVTTAPPSVRSSVSPPAVDVNPADGSSTQQQAANRDGGNTQGSNLHGSSAPSPVVKTDAETPNLLNQVPENDEIMSLINDVNATHSSGVDRQGLDFSSALDHYQNSDGNYPLTQQQRNEMLTLMANSSNGGAAQSNNALVSPDPPPMPSLEQYNQTQEQLDMLQRLQMEQDAKVQQLADRLQPLSPTGAIPGLTDGQYYHGDQDLTGNPGEFDINSFLNDADYFAVQGDGDVGNSMNFDGPIDDDFFNLGDTSNMPNGFTGDQDGQHGSRVASVDSSVTSPTGTIETVQEDGETSPKRRKTQK